MVGSDLIALDTETCLILPGVKVPPLVCVSWASGEDVGLLHWTEAEAFVCEALEGETTFANAPYDLVVFMRAYPRTETLILKALADGRIHDVQIREKLNDLAAGTFQFEINENGEVKYKGYSLDAISNRRIGQGKIYDEWRLRYHELIDKPLAEWPDDARTYAMVDAAITLKVHESQQDHPNEAPQNRAHFALHMASCRGIMTSHERLEALFGDTMSKPEHGMDELAPLLIENGLLRIEGGVYKRRTKNAVIRMANTLGPKCKLTDKGEEQAAEGRDVISYAQTNGKFVSVDKESCDMSGDAALIAYGNFSKLLTLSGVIEKLWKGTKVPIQTRFEPLMETGRTSSRSPNIQNIRREPGVRECFIPRPGYVFVSADYSSAELHTLAQSCQDLFGYSKLGDALNEGRDVHLWLGSMIIDREYDLAAYLAGDEELGHGRQMAKAANFGFPGGCGALRFCGIAKGYGIDLDEYRAQRLRAIWFQAWPEMHEFFDYVGSCTDDRGWYFANLPRSNRLRGRATYTAACNTHFQGPASDGAKAALWEVCREQRSGRLRGSFIVNFVHDEIIMETPEHLAHEHAMVLKEIMEREFNRFVPDCPTEAEPTVMRYWSKKAKPVWEDGRLVPWS